ncbi:glycosyltransferase family 2 protein [Tranquillimonas rosea]|uniref:glycosyltransferase family 2 protein n=1 Tax=Tranquillimonas rosea TaxID=641238 RepID=UPI003BACE79C
MTRFAVVTAMRNEGPHLLEWVAHTRAVGADDILVISNDCDDGSDNLLDALAAGGAVTHLRQELPRSRTPQWAALRLAGEHPAVRDADWIAVLDCDEFINLRPPLSRLSDLVARVEADAIVLPWRLFGHAGHTTRPAGGTLASYTRAIPDDALYPPLSRFFKTLYRRRGPFQKPGVHRPKQRPDSVPHWVDGSGQALPDSFAAASDRIMLWGAPLATGLVQLNHYSLRSAEDFLLKRARGLPNRHTKPIDMTYWVERNFNTVEDTSIAHLRPAMQAEAARLRALPGVAEAEAACLSRARAAFERLLDDPETLQFYGRLLLATDSTPPDAETALRLVRRFAAARGAGA